MSAPKHFHVITLNREGDISPENTLQIDGKEIKGIQNVKIEYGLDNRIPVVTIQLLVKKVAGTIKTNKVNIKGKKK